MRSVDFRTSSRRALNPGLWPPRPAAVPGRPHLFPRARRGQLRPPADHLPADHGDRRSYRQPGVRVRARPLGSAARGRPGGPV